MNISGLGIEWRALFFGIYIYICGQKYKIIFSEEMCLIYLFWTKLRLNIYNGRRSTAMCGKIANIKTTKFET